MSLRVLVMDDADNTVDALCRVLARLGYAAAGCTRPLDCVELARQFRPDVILLDLEMPALDGFHLAVDLRACAELNCRLIALTGHADKEMRDRCTQAGFDGFLSKPVAAEQLQAALAGD
jgi:CheY-like chemotaxis protein